MKFLITISALCIIASAAVMAIPAWENSLGGIGGVMLFILSLVGALAQLWLFGFSLVILWLIIRWFCKVNRLVNKKLKE